MDKVTEIFSHAHKRSLNKEVCDFLDNFVYLRGDLALAHPLKIVEYINEALAFYTPVLAEDALMRLVCKYRYRFPLGMMALVGGAQIKVSHYGKHGRLVSMEDRPVSLAAEGILTQIIYKDHVLPDRYKERVREALTFKEAKMVAQIRWLRVRDAVRVRPYALHWMERRARRLEERRIKNAKRGILDDDAVLLVPSAKKVRVEKEV